jgi:hypothetical protein
MLVDDSFRTQTRMHTKSLVDWIFFINNILKVFWCFDGAGEFSGECHVVKKALK